MKLSWLWWTCLCNYQFSVKFILMLQRLSLWKCSLVLDLSLKMILSKITIFFFFLHKLWAFHKWGSWLILIFLTFYQFIFSLVSFCFFMLLLLDQFLVFCRGHSLGILSEFVNSVFSEFLLAWRAYICSPDECIHFESIFTTLSHKKFKDLAPLSPPINYCWWEVWGQCDSLFYFFSCV